jgi:hypothetical protein
VQVVAVAPLLNKCHTSLAVRECGGRRHAPGRPNGDCDIVAVCGRWGVVAGWGIAVAGSSEDTASLGEGG